MGNSDKQFEANLEYGNEGETLVHSFLIKHFDYVEDNRFQRREHSVGPKLRGRKAPYPGITLPDFTAFNEGHKPVLIDAKAKKSAFYLDGKRYFAIDVDKMHDYLKCVEVKGAVDLWLAIVYNSNIYMYTPADINRRYTFNNEFGSDAYLFELDAQKIVDFKE
jgi:hypothetical protein